MIEMIELFLRGVKLLFGPVFTEEFCDREDGKSQGLSNKVQGS